MGKRAESRAVGAPASGPGLCKCPCSPPIPRSSRGPGVAGPRSADSRLAHKNGLCFLAGGRACGVGGGPWPLPRGFSASNPAAARPRPQLEPETCHDWPRRRRHNTEGPPGPRTASEPRERERESERASERGGGPPGQPLRDPRPGAPSPPSLRRPAARRRASAPSVPARATRARGGWGQR